MTSEKSTRPACAKSRSISTTDQGVNGDRQPKTTEDAIQPSAATQNQVLAEGRQKERFLAVYDVTNAVVAVCVTVFVLFLDLVLWVWLPRSSLTTIQQLDVRNQIDSATSLAVCTMCLVSSGLFILHAKWGR